MAKILVIDDQRDNLISIKALIETYRPEYHVLTAASGQEGIDLAGSEKPDAILLDVNMPKMDGYKVCRRLKQKEDLNYIPIIFLTAVKTGPQDRIKGLELGGDAYLTKPVDEGELIAQLDVMLRIKNAEDELRLQNEILEQKVIERTKSLRASEDRHRKLVELAPNGIVVIDSSGIVGLANSALLHMSGYDKDELIGKHFTTFAGFRAADIPGFVKIFAKVLKGEIPQPFEIEWSKKNGALIATEIHISVVRTEKGISEIIVIVRDLTERKRAEEALKKSEQWNKEIFKGSRDAIFIIDKNSHFVDVNNAAEILTGYAKEELLKMSIPDLHDEQDLEAYNKYFKRIISGESVVSEAKILRKDGTKVDTEFNNTKFNIGPVLYVLAAARDITRRKKAEEKLRNTLKELAASEKRLKSIIETEPECVKILDCEGKLVEMNRAGLDMIEAESLEKVQRRSVLPIIAPEYRSAFQQMLQRVINGSKEKLVFEIIGLKGTRRWLETHSVPLQNAENEIIGLLGVTRDITKRKKLEDDLVFERDKFDFILQKLPVGVSVLDADHKFIYVNPLSMKLDGYPSSPKIILGEHVLDHHQGRDRSKVEQLLHDYVSGQKSVSVREAERGNRTVEISYHALRDAQDKYMGLVRLISDITERKRVEEESRRHIKELTTIYDAARKLQYLHTPATLAQELIAIMEQNLSYEFGAVMRIDESTGALIPFALSDQGRGPEFVNVDKDYVLKHHISVGKGVTGWVAQSGQSVRLGDVRSDPRYHAVREDIRSELCVPLQAGNRVVGVLNVETSRADAYTESDQRVLETIASQMALAIQQSYLHEQIQHHAVELEQCVDERTAQLQASNKELEAFAYSVSHDLRAPLRAIGGFTHILMQDYVEKLDAEGKRLGSIIQENTRKMSQLIDDLLNFSRLGRASMRFSEIDMLDMAKAIFHEATLTEDRGRVKFTIGALPKAQGDPNMMRQVWMNLFSNALKFSAHRQQAIISVSCRKKGNEFVYCVKDNGAGFDMDYKDKLFGVFQRLHSEDEFKGTGVGLALVQRIIRRHGGTVWAEGKVDGGAAFCFSLPRKKSA